MDSTARLEICVDSIESALSAVKGGATRIELCSALSEGGLTPSIGTLYALKRILEVQIPIFCMLRPRQGNDFIYSESEIHSILYDIEILKSHGSDGFVFGALDSNRKVNVEQCKSVLVKAQGLPVTFHRAFDLTNKNEMHNTCNLIQQLGFQRILTSGFEQTAELGIDNIQELVNLHPAITIVAGSGISKLNLHKILTTTQCKEFHASAKKLKTLPGAAGIALGKESNDSTYVTDADIVRELIEIANCVAS